MTDLLALCLRIAGAGLILLAIMHVPIGFHLEWREDARRLSPVNRDIFHVHSLFVCLVLVAMGLPCLIEPSLLLEKSRPAAWGAWILTIFWLVRLYCQWFVYRRELWHGKPFETRIHWMFTGIWLALTVLFASCAAYQSGWIH
jgi:hypothetical protein